VLVPGKVVAEAGQPEQTRSVREAGGGLGLQPFVPV